MSPRKFDPQPGDRFEILNRCLVAQPHPAHPTYVFSSDGQRGTVYQMRDEASQEILALKVFIKKYQEPELAESLARLQALRGLPGMKAAQRSLILPGDPASVLYPELAYAALMPWIQGKTWYDVLVSSWKGGVYLALDSAIRVCQQFLHVMQGLEKSGVAHSDISPGNVTIEMDRGSVQLLDLEDAYIPGSPKPRYLNMGSAGYRHSSAGRITFWCPEGDRYAAAVLAAEILILANPDLSRHSTDQGYFTDDSRSDDAKRRFSAACPWLYSVSPQFTEVFQKAWWSAELTDCPRLAELHDSILPVAQLLPRNPRPVSLIKASPGKAEAPAPPPAPKEQAPVTWGNHWEPQEPSAPPNPPPRPPVQPQSNTSHTGCWLLTALFVSIVMLFIPGLNAISGCVLIPAFCLMLGWWVVWKALK